MVFVAGEEVEQQPQETDEVAQPENGSANSEEEEEEDEAPQVRRQQQGQIRMVTSSGAESAQATEEPAPAAPGSPIVGTPVAQQSQRQPAAPQSPAATAVAPQSSAAAAATPQSPAATGTTAAAAQQASLEEAKRRQQEAMEKARAEALRLQEEARARAEAARQQQQQAVEQARLQAEQQQLKAQQEAAKRQAEERAQQMKMQQQQTAQAQAVQAQQKQQQQPASPSATAQQPKATAAAPTAAVAAPAKVPPQQPQAPKAPQQQQAKPAAAAAPQPAAKQQPKPAAPVQQPKAAAVTAQSKPTPPPAAPTRAPPPVVREVQLPEAPSQPILRHAEYTPKLVDSIVNKLPPGQEPEEEQLEPSSAPRNPIIEDNAWQVQCRVQPEYQPVQPAKLNATGDFLVESEAKKSIVPEAVGYSKVKWNEFPEEEEKERQSVAKVKTQEWVPEHDVEHHVQKTVYQPGRIGPDPNTGRLWPPAGYGEEEQLEIGKADKAKCVADDGWIMSNGAEPAEEDAEVGNAPWKGQTRGGDVKNRQWPPPENAMEKELGKGGRISAQWPPPEQEELEQQRVEILQTHIPVKDKVREWQPRTLFPQYETEEGA